MNKYMEWCDSDYFDEDTKKELDRIKDNEAEIQDRFYKDLDFGTGGLRGVIGVGTNRMNIYTVRKATQGLANCILAENKADKGVVIAYDSRNMSPEFADEAALCLSANGIKTYVFETLRPTPELSFAVRELKCVAGIVVTASHNPPEYNGYKVYWEDGAQITYPKDKEIINEVNKVTDYNMVKTMSKEEAANKGLYNVIGKEIDDKYIAALKGHIIQPELIQKTAKDIKIVYTPLHGAGNVPVKRILEELGFEQLYVVSEQEKPDGNFPTVSYPNPEDANAFALALVLAKEVDADIILATDPDADRLGVYAKDAKTGEYISFTGNMSGMLIAEYILSMKKEMGVLPENGEAYQVKLIEVLTGFKYIGEQIKLFEENQTHEYVFGLEESYGCLIGTYARDKDAVSAVMALCEVAAYCKSKNETLWDMMISMYEKYGYYREGLHSITLKGMDGIAQMTKIINDLRENPPKKLGKLEVLKMADYQNSTLRDMKSDVLSDIALPVSNVLYFELSNNSWCCARPSGTEPKIKFYMGVKGENLADADEKLQELTKEVLTIVGV